MTMSPVATSDLTAAQVHETIGKYMLVDGFDFVLDLEESRGSTIVDARTGDALESRNCIGCGLCSYVCPTRLPLATQIIRLRTEISALPVPFTKEDDTND